MEEPEIQPSSSSSAEPDLRTRIIHALHSPDPTLTELVGDDRIVTRDLYRNNSRDHCLIHNVPRPDEEVD